MINFLHTFQPNPIMFSIGPVHIYWYGFFIVLGIVAAISASLKLAKYYGIKTDHILDLSFWLVIAGIAGARIFHILIEWQYYLSQPSEIFNFRQGGLAIHGAIIFGLAALYIFTKKRKINFWILSGLLVPGLALAQSFGRWGNYFNQELFGKPTSLPWGIPIKIMNRPFEYMNFNYFHPAFLYESLGDLIIFIILIAWHVIILKKKSPGKLFSSAGKKIVLSYLVLYSFLRFMTEFIRVDPAYVFAGLRHAQITSLLIIAAAGACLLYGLRKTEVKIKPAP